MSEAIDFYVNLLGGNMAGLSAVSALKSLDDSAAKATARIQGLESQVEAAKAKLEATKAATGNIEALSSQLAAAKAHLDAIKSGKTPFDPKEYKRASDEVSKLSEKTEQAKAKHAAAIEAQKSKVDGLTKKIGEEKAAQASSANLQAAKRAQIVKGLDEQVSKLGSVLGAAKDAGGPVGNLAGKLEGLGKGGAVGVAIAVAVALAALAASAVVATVALARYAIVAADAARSSALLSSAAAGSGSAGWELERVVDQLSNTIPQTRQKTAEWARELALANIAGRDMQRTLTTMGTVASAVGDQAAGKIKGIAEASRMAQRLMLGARDRFGEFASLQGTGIKAADIYAAVAKSMRTSIPEAKRMVDAGIVPFRRGLEALEQAANTRFGPIVARQMLSLDTQISKLKENMARLFSGANIEKFLEGLKTVTDLFDTNTVTGYVLKEVFTSVFTSISEVAAKVFPYIKAAIMGVALGVIIVATAAKQLYRQFQETFGGAGKGIDGVQLAFKIGVAAVGALVGGILGLTAALVGLGVVAAIALAPVWVPFALMGLMIYGAVKAITAVVDAAKELGQEISDIDLGQAAEDMIDGLINGIKAKIGDVKDAILSVSSVITGAFNSDQEIRSPGRKAMRQGRYVAEGHAKGLAAGEQTVERASMGVSAATTRGLEGGESGGGAPTAQSAEPPITFNNCTFGADPEEFRRIIREERRLFFLGEARGFAMAGG